MTRARRSASISFVLVLGLCLAGRTRAQGGGPFAVALVPDVTIENFPSSGPIPPIFAGEQVSFPIHLRVWYPVPPQAPGAIFVAPPGGGPKFPLILFLHGFGGQPDNYDLLLGDLASWGFVVAAPSYSRAVDDMSPHDQAFEAWVVAERIREEAANPTGAFPNAEQVDAAPSSVYTVVGHSMGGVAAFYLAEADPRARRLILLEPYRGLEIAAIGPVCGPLPNGLVNGWTGAVPCAEHFGGEVAILSGLGDYLAPPSATRFWFDRGEIGPVHPTRNLLISIEGMGHFGPVDHAALGTDIYYPGCPAPVPLGPMAGPDQHALHRLFVSTLTRSLLGDALQQNLLAELPGFGPVDFSAAMNGMPPAPVGVSLESRSRDPLVWTAPDPVSGAIRMGFAAHPSDYPMVHGFLADPNVNDVPGMPGWEWLGALPIAWFDDLAAFVATGRMGASAPAGLEGYDLGFRVFLMGLDRTTLSPLALVHL